MKVAFHLRRRPSPEAASAILLESHRPEALLDLASKLGRGQSPRIYRVFGGFLVKLAEGVEPPIGPIRLRRLAEDLYLPVDADLVPTLLDDEARGVTRNRGLIFLPGGRVLEFRRNDPLRLSSLLTAVRREGLDWLPFPSRPDRAERLSEIRLEAPEGLDEDVFEAGGDGHPSEIGSEGPPRPEEAGAASTLAGKAAVGAGKGLIGLGAMLGIKALADLGARWINGAVERVPRLTEAILGEQEGALRELLRQFREGEIDKALRHALPLNGPGGRGGAPSTDGKLPTVDPTYSIRALLASGRGSNGLWFGGFDVQAELVREYRKAAEEAERQGDFRRAAYIYGKLLNDFATAAFVLIRGGLHRDAALIFLNRLKDIRAAAREFEAAGEVDRALLLYRQHRFHAEAGDLLRRVGEEDEAVDEYTWAAEALASESEAPLGLLAAGDLLKDRARRPDLALAFYARGWAARPSTVAVACSLRMAAIHADSGEAGPLLALVAEADSLLRGSGPEAPAVEFYNEVATLAARESLAEARDEILDRCLMGLAAKLRQQVASRRGQGLLASTYFGRNKAWSTDQVGDANQALKAAFNLETERRRALKLVLLPDHRGDARRIPVDGGVVSAACHAPTTGEVFVGFEGGRVYRFEVAGGVASLVFDEGAPIASMAVDTEGRNLVLLLDDGDESRRMVHLGRVASSAGGWTRQARTIVGTGDSWLTPVMSDGPIIAVGIWVGEELILMGGPDELAHWTTLPMAFLKTSPPAAILVPSADGRPPTPRAVLVHDGPDICHVESMGRGVRRRYLGWRPTLTEGHTLRSAPLSWLQVEPERFELAGLDREGVIHWSSLKVNDVELIRPSNNISMGETVYSATTLVRAGLVAGVTAGKVDWLRCGPRAFTLTGSTEVSAYSPLACFPAYRTDELVIVCRDGTLVCVPMPR